jgi:hypothetical protein
VLTGLDRAYFALQTVGTHVTWRHSTRDVPPFYFWLRNADRRECFYILSGLIWREILPPRQRGDRNLTSSWSAQCATLFVHFSIFVSKCHNVATDICQRLSTLTDSSLCPADMNLDVIRTLVVDENQVLCRVLRAFHRAVVRRERQRQRQMKDNFLDLIPNR